MNALDPARWAVLSPQIDELLALPSQQRSRRLDDIATHDPVTAGELRALLLARDDASRVEFLSAPAASAWRPVGATAGDVLGAWTLVEAIGEGGMGSVWRARRSDGRFEGEAAVKLLRRGLFDAATQERFRREGAMLARLHHPGIAQLLDAGITPQGQPYLVLELVRGESLDRWCDARSLGVRQRVELFLQVLDAVAAAHGQLVIHRDLKPSNILVDDSGRVKLLDFGIARLLDDELAPALTQAGAMALTPAYAAPEQFDGSPLSLATDVYALGIVLHELLVGVHPAGGAGSASAVHYQRAASGDRPTRASERATTHTIDGSDAGERARLRRETPLGLRRRLRGDLDNILARALASVASKRYATVGEFAADLHRHLHHEPVSAHEAGAWYLGAKFVRRHRLAVGLSAAVLLSLSAGLAATLWQAREAERAGLQALAERDRAQRMLARRDAAYGFTSLLLTQFGQAGHPMTFKEIIEKGERLASQRNVADPATHAYVLLVLADYQDGVGDPKNAKRLAEQARALARQSGDLPLLAMTQCVLGVSLSMLGEAAAGDALIAEAIPLAEGDTDALSTCWEQRSQVALRSFDGAHMLDYAGRALATLGDGRSQPVRLALMQGALAEAYSLLGRYTDADASYAKAVQTLQDAGALESIEASTIYNSWGVQARQCGRLRQALERYRYAMRVQAAILGDDAVTPAALINTARLLTDLGQLDEAQSLADRGLQRARAGRDDQGEFFAEIALAKLLRLKGRLAEAAQRLGTAQQQVGALRQAPPGMTRRLALDQAQLERAQGRPDSALARLDALCRELLAHSSTGKPDAIEQAVLLERAKTLAALGRVVPALADARESLRLARALQRDAPSSAHTGWALLTLAELQLITGEHEAALASAREAAKQLSDAVGAEHADTRAALVLASR